MDLSEVDLFEQQVRPLRLSEAIRQGCPYVKENMIFSGCAIGTGYWRLTGRNLSEDRIVDRLAGGHGNAVSMVARAFGIPRGVVAQVSNDHYTRLKTREQCADYLEGLGY